MMLFVENVPFKMNEMDLRQLFSPCGTIISVEIYRLLFSANIKFYDRSAGNKANQLDLPTGENYRPMYVLWIDEQGVLQPNAGRHFGVRVFGFNKKITRNDLRNVFRDAGNIFEIVMKVNSKKVPYAFIKYNTEEAMMKAYAWKTCTVGYPPQDVKIDKKLSKVEGNPHRFCVRVTGFNKTTSHSQLRNVFKDAGNVVHVAKRLNSDGVPYALVIYDTEEAMNKALAWKTSSIGFPAQTVKIGRTSNKKPSLNSHKAKHFNELLRTFRQMSLKEKRNVVEDYTCRLKVLDKVDSKDKMASEPQIIQQIAKPVAAEPKAVLQTGKPIVKEEQHKEKIVKFALDIFEEGGLAGISTFTDEDFSDTECIGEGTFSFVYHAYSSMLGPVAVKYHKVHQWSFAEQKELYHMLKNSTHPNIVRFLGVILHAGLKTPSGIVMEYMENDTVYDALHNNGMDIGSLLKYSWICQSARALNYLHSRTLIHRDMKTLNMLLCNDFKILKICDLGNMRNFNCMETMTGGSDVGTFIYNAPEITTLNRKDQYDSSADVYSLCICIWEIVVRRKPFDHISDEISRWRLALQIAEQDERPIVSAIEDSDIRTIVERGWHRNSLERPKAAEIALYFEKKYEEVVDLVKED